ncbi:hypothetical protein GCM10025883_36380 [Mobilicoccus caccae]|uniref:Uncharacterized protein n=1 Tax=Mobilicoccus caccae TaxID=1859295 RepID=A0ABQ6IWD5_9MICO|nr:hypothetical protein GCM10025883_36380 [Mobilicoccus caccae]
MAAISHSRGVHSGPEARHRYRTKRAGLLLALVPLVATVAFGVLFLADRPTYLAVVVEDGPVEFATMAVYVVAVVLALVVARRRAALGDRLGTIAYVLLAAGFFFIAGEEVTWFQRQLGFAGPEALVERNIQGEANLHNLLGRYALHGAYIVVGLWGLGLGRVVARFLPFARPVWLYAPFAHRWTWFFPVTGYYVFIDYVGPVLVGALGPALQDIADGPARFQEPMELLLAFGFALFVLDALRMTGRPVRSGGGRPPSRR